MARHKFSLGNDDALWLDALRRASADEVARRWAQANGDMAGWKLVALARRVVAVGLPLVLPPRLVTRLEQRRRHGRPAHEWAALPNLQRLAGG